MLCILLDDIISCVRRSRDYYHICYGLSGLSVSQHLGGSKECVNICPSDDCLLVTIVLCLSYLFLIYFIHLFSHALIQQRGVFRLYTLLILFITRDCI